MKVLANYLSGFVFTSLLYKQGEQYGKKIRVSLFPSLYK